MGQGCPVFGAGRQKRSGKSPKVAKSRQLHNRSESPKSRHHLRQQISDDSDEKKKKTRGPIPEWDSVSILYTS